jgi:hypothetical protein
MSPELAQILAAINNDVTQPFTLEIFDVDTDLVELTTGPTACLCARLVLAAGDLE